MVGFKFEFEFIGAARFLKILHKLGRFFQQMQSFWKIVSVLVLKRYFGNIGEIRKMLNFRSSATCDTSDPYTTWSNFLNSSRPRLLPRNPMGLRKHRAALKPTNSGCQSQHRNRRKSPRNFPMAPNINSAGFSTNKVAFCMEKTPTNISRYFTNFVFVL